MYRSRDLKPVIPLIALALIALLPVGIRASTPTVDGAWSMLDPTNVVTPGARREYAAVYDYQRNRYIVFGGLQYPPYSLTLEVWSLTLDPVPTWSLLDIEGLSPGGRHSPQWGYDPARERLIIFGGYGSHLPGDPYDYLNDVWQLSLNGAHTWTELQPTGTPPEGRLAGSAVYDPLRQRFVGFGGTRGLPVDTWVLDLSGGPAWVSMPVDTTGGGSANDGPPGSYGMTGIYDIFRDRMLMFGGSTSDEYHGVQNDVWELSLSDPLTWTELAPGGPLPSARRTLTSVHDLVRDRMVIFGGWDSQSDQTSSFLNDTWALSLGSQPAWSQLSPTGPLPTGRDAMAGIYDPAGDRMVVFGGWSGTTMLGDTWFLDWGLDAASPSVTGSSQATPGAASLNWDVQNVTGERAGVYRRQEGTPWTSIATVENGGSGTLTFQDQDVTPGERYGYLLAVPSLRGAVVGGETWVDVPTSASVPQPSLSFGLRPVRPNPVVDRFRASITLVGEAAARIDLMDVTGRRVLSRDLSGLGPGPHEVDLGNARDFRSGLYFLRLTQAGRSLARPVVLSGRRAN